MNGDTQGMRQLTYREAVREAMREAMHKDARVFLMGEDVGRYGLLRRQQGSAGGVRPGAYP